MKNNIFTKILACLVVILIATNAFFISKYVSLKKSIAGCEKNISLSIYDDNSNLLKEVNDYKTFSANVRELLEELNKNNIIDVTIENSTYGGFISSMMGKTAMANQCWFISSTTNNLCVGYEFEGMQDMCQKGIDNLYLQPNDIITFVLANY